MTAEVLFLEMDDGRRGQRFCVLHAASNEPVRGAVVYVHPLAEEMNKSRRMAALQARALAEAGYVVLQIDLLGCGDSSGDFGDATWDDWVEDVVQACRWLQRRHAAPLWLWGLRAGCLIASDAAQRLESASRFLFWQAPSSGKPLLQQFLRLKLAGELLEGKSRGAMDAMRQQLAAGSTLEIAGYVLAPALAAGLDQAVLKAPPGNGRVAWVEVAGRVETGFALASERLLTQWRDAGVEVASRIVVGPAFWQTTEIEDAPDAIEASLAALVAPVDAMTA